MSFETELEQLEKQYESLNNIRLSIVDGLKEKGVSVDENLKITEIADSIRNIDGGTKKPLYFDFNNLNMMSTSNLTKFGFYEWPDMEGLFNGNSGSYSNSDYTIIDVSEKQDKTLAIFWGTTSSSYEPNSGVLFQKGYDVRSLDLTMAFQYKPFEEIDLRQLKIEQGVQFDMMFYNCRNLKFIYCNDDWTSINRNLENAYTPFAGCDALWEQFPNLNGETSGKYCKPSDLGGFFTRKE